MRLSLTVAFVFLSTGAVAQEVRPIPDAISYATAAVNPTWAAIDAWRSDHRWCRLGQLGISEGIGNTIALVMKSHINSPRPCAGCAPDGLPSGHTMNATIGFSGHWIPGVGLGLGTGGLRYLAHRHNWYQIGAGFGIGIGADFAGRLLKCDD